MDTLAYTLDINQTFWFRGHSSKNWSLTPSALRYDNNYKRKQALELVSQLKRYLPFKLSRLPDPEDELDWMQVAQHYGIPTRLLDWTQNAAVALYFACRDQQNDDGLIITINPLELNAAVTPTDVRIFNSERDITIIRKYYSLGPMSDLAGEPTIAIHPTWNTERILLQQGFFTLHGSRRFTLDRSQATSIVCYPVLHEHKQSLLQELARVGVGEMFIFPEPEHVCSHLKRIANLDLGDNGG